MTSARTFRLDPLPSDDASWSISTVREAIWVGADSDQQAREVAALKTLKARTIRPGEKIPVSPWHDAKLTSCVWETNRTDLGRGEAALADGTRLPKI